jgi:hypothetical protein
MRLESAAAMRLESAAAMRLKKGSFPAVQQFPWDVGIVAGFPAFRDSLVPAVLPAET